MSRNRKRRRAIRWARYLNRYTHINEVNVVTWGTIRAMALPGDHWMHVRRQAKHRDWRSS